MQKVQEHQHLVNIIYQSPLSASITPRKGNQSLKHKQT